MNYALLLSGISVACTILMVGYNIFFAPSRAMRREAEARLSKLEQLTANHDNRFTGILQENEREKDRQDERCKRMENELSAVTRMREELATIKAVQNAQSENIKEIKDTMNRIFNLLQPSKN